MAPKTYVAPKVWRRPYTTIYNDNYRYGTGLYSSAISDLESKELIPARSTRGHPVFYYSSLSSPAYGHRSLPPTHPSFYTLQRHRRYRPLAVDSYETYNALNSFSKIATGCSNRPLSYHYYIPELDALSELDHDTFDANDIIDSNHVGTSPSSTLALDSISASRDAATRRAEAAIAAAEHTLHTSDLAINRSRAIEAMEAAMSDANDTLRRTRDVTLGSSLARSASPPLYSSSTLHRPRPPPLPRALSPRPHLDIHSRHTTTGEQDYASDIAGDLASPIKGTVNAAQNRWYTNSVRSVRPDVYIEAHQFRSLLV